MPYIEEPYSVAPYSGALFIVNDDAVYDARLTKETKDIRTLTKLGILYRAPYNRIEQFMPNVYVFQPRQIGIIVEPDVLHRFCEENNVSAQWEDHPESDLPDLVLTPIPNDE